MRRLPSSPTSPTSRPHATRPAPAPRLRLGWQALLGLLLASLPASPARAEGCEDCAAPSAQALRSQPGFGLFVRQDRWGARREDTLHLDAGACAYAPASTPVARLGKSWMVLRGTGTVASCPWGSTDASVSVSIAEGDSTDWRVEGEVQVELKAVALSTAASAKTGVAHGRTLQEVRQVTQRIEAAPGHVIDWEGWFELADLTLDLDLSVTRRYAWWTKNPLTGDHVHAAGEVLVDCGRERVTLRRQASLGVRFRLWDAPCDGSTPPVDLGTFPRPRPAPVLTPPAAPVAPPPAREAAPRTASPAAHPPRVLDEPDLHAEPGRALPWEPPADREPIPEAALPRHAPRGPERGDGGWTPHEGLPGWGR
ncbi:MAG: hypothetical protein ACKOCB_07235 [Planctomycetia bacterium]